MSVLKGRLSRWFKSSSWGAVLFGFLGAAFLSACIFPEFLVFFNLEFITNSFWADYWGAFTLTSFFYQGGVQLWDAYDQLPFAYYCLTIGIYKFFNILVAFFYIIFSPLHHFQAEFFHQTYSFVFFLSNLFLKFVGAYLLFGKFSANRWLVIGASIYLSVIGSAIPFASGGLSYGSYIPLLIYLTLNLFEHCRLRDLLAWLLLMGIILADHLQHATYLYLGIHFFILACVAWALGRRDILVRHWKMPMDQGVVAGALLALLMMVVPVAWMLKILVLDVDFGQGSRISQLWDWHYYFTRDISINHVSLAHFFSTLVGFYKFPSWLCVGYVMVFFALFGLVASFDKRRWLFLVPLVAMYMLNCPRESLAGGLAHTLNFLTNPLSFSVKNFQELHLYFLPVWVMGLAVMGMEAFYTYAKNQSLVFQHKKKLGLFIVALLVYVTLTWPPFVGQVRLYLMVQLLISLGAMYVCFLLRSKKLAALLLGALLLIDSGVMIYYNRSNSLDPYIARAHVIEGRPDLGLMGVNYQNPRILPFREHFDLGVYAEENNPYLFSWRNLSVPGMFYRYTNFARNLFESLENRPRHKAYAFWDKQQQEMFAYLSADTRLILDGSALANSDGSYTFRADKPRPFSMWQMSMPVGNDPIPLLKGPYAYVQIPIPMLNIADQQQGKARREDSISPYYASTFLTADKQSVQFFVVDGQGGAKALEPLQGQVVRPWTFDVNNIRQGYLTAAFLPQDYPVGKNVVIAAKALPQQGLIKVKHFRLDTLVFEYGLPKDAWLAFHYPYDDKWEIKVDGQKVPFYRVNKSFIGLPLTAGNHEIAISYWPDSPLRILLFISALIAFVILWVIIHASLKDSLPVKREEI